MIRVRGAAIIALVAVVMAAGCKSGSEPGGGEAARVEPLPVQPADQAAVDALRALPFNAASVAIVVEVLGRAKVGVYPDEATDGSEPVRLTRWQVGNMAAEAANGGGVHGTALSELAAVPDGAPPMSYLLAAWVMRYPSPSAGFARALMGEQDWRHADQIVFPKLLLTLFVADALAAGPDGYRPARQGAALRPVAAVTTSLPGPCSAANSFIQNAIADVANALKVDTSGGGILGFLGSIWNFAVDLAAGVVQGLIKAFKTLVVGVLIDAFAVIAVIQEVFSYVVEWRADLLPKPESNRFGIGNEVVTGQLEVQVVDNQLPIPDLVKDCAKVFGVDMTRLGSAEGSEVDWDFYSPGRADLATPTRSDPRLDEKRTARFTYRTGQESPELAATGDERADLFRLKASVHRNDVEKIRELLSKLVLDQLPAAIADVVRPLAQRVFNAATERLRDLTDVTATERVAVSFHVPDNERTPKPPGGITDPVDPAAIPEVCDLLADEEIARVLGFQVGYAKPELETRESAIAQGLPVSPTFQWSRSCEKSTANYEAYWATAPAERKGLPPYVRWFVDAHTDSSDARAKVANYLALEGHSRLDGVGDEAIVSRSTLIARVGTYTVLIGNANTEGTGVPYPRDKFVEMAQIIASRL